MSGTPVQVNDHLVVEVSDFDQLLHALTNRGYEIIGPVVRDGAIVYDHVASTSDLPSGWTDEQSGGTYRLKRRSDAALFGYAVGPHSWKKFLHPPTQRLWEAKREGNTFRILPDSPAPPKRAFLGVRACELHAIAVQDKVFLKGEYVEPGYQARRDNVFIVAVNCGQAGGTCFCVSMKTGPKATSGYDLSLTEVLAEGSHHFVVHAGSPLGAEVLSEVRHRIAAAAETRAADEIVEETARHMGRHMDTAGIKELLYQNYEHPRWENVAQRCLTCANCTMVCPTCFCTTVEDVTDLGGEHAERWRKWDSCFTMDFSYIHGGTVRATTKSRYRQWMTHKLATWIDQFGSSGCVGCGRCITWCPVAIDITEEVRAIRESQPADPPAARKDGQ
ncbi:MAG TPA: 4Fe-4S dicluster domain-containing protein [Candidatus Acidoferrales bacterium]|jgi:formate hydrogenlyase subunit 6/NADH:ubiquinone oxidoreductase subunit I|nr:4Fe-4S dicluster domain-containing protein [Candidatus Acidoferrales bacterium]